MKKLGMLVVLLSTIFLVSGCGAKEKTQVKSVNKTASSKVSETQSSEEVKKTEEKQVTKESTKKVALPLSLNVDKNGELVAEANVKYDTFEPDAYFLVDEGSSCSPYYWLVLGEDNLPKKDQNLGIEATEENFKKLEAIPFECGISSDAGLGYLSIYNIESELASKAYGSVDVAEKIPDVKDDFNHPVKEIKNGEGKSNGIDYKYALITFGGEYQDGKQHFILLYSLSEKVRVKYESVSLSNDFDLDTVVENFGQALSLKK